MNTSTENALRTDLNVVPFPLKESNKPQPAARHMSFPDTVNSGAVAAVTRHACSKAPGLQYRVVNADGVVFELAHGWADVRRHMPMTMDTMMMAHSMTATFTAVAILQLVEQRLLTLDDFVADYLPRDIAVPMHVTIRQLLGHMPLFPSPLSFEWMHRMQDDEGFDEPAALAALFREPKRYFELAEGFVCSHIGYWLLGRVLEDATGQSYKDYVRAMILRRLQLFPQEMDFVVRGQTPSAADYLPKYSAVGLLQRLAKNGNYQKGCEGKWLRLEPLLANGPAFGGLIGTARAFSKFLQDQLRQTSVLLRPSIKRLLETVQKNQAGELLPMTLGWRVQQTGHGLCLYKDGRGGGSRSEMRLYPHLGLGSVVMANSACFNTHKFLDHADSAFL